MSLGAVRGKVEATCSVARKKEEQLSWVFKKKKKFTCSNF